MHASVNRVVLLGLVSKWGVELSYAPSGTACARFALYVAEQGGDGREHSTLIACEIWGKRAEAASELAPGQLVFFEGKVGKRKKGEAWEMVIVGYDVVPLAVAAEAVDR